ncbi:MAG: 2-oxo-4-hydroxy-4-carboxy-5-ureidoimidazoline decarboxylase [Thermoanaerobaculia bacterium]|nr:2-oxo-4-hydroxy-4-carboxy-5-ureidoimidazoline decarboxylase [Thermoanaerobaculia bacterium]
MSLRELNDLGAGELTDRLAACCGSRRWTREVAARRPFSGESELFDAAELAADAMERQDWLEAFSHHPRIGDVDSLRRRFGATSGGWSAGEQAGMTDASDAMIERLAAANRRYEERFGYLFIVCATGKSAGEMLALLEERLGNHAESELAIAAGEQRKITRLRLEKLLADI